MKKPTAAWRTAILDNGFYDTYAERVISALGYGTPTVTVDPDSLQVSLQIKAGDLYWGMVFEHLYANVVAPATVARLADQAFRRAREKQQ